MRRRQESEAEFCHSVGILSGSVHDDDVACGGSLKVNVVESGTGAYDDAEFRSGVHHFSVDFVGADDDGFCIAYSLEHGSTFGVRFKECQFVSGSFHDFADAVYGSCCKGFFGKNENFHNFFSIFLCGVGECVLYILTMKL